jgi:uncharacterized protein (UPF0332 family)
MTSKKHQDYINYRLAKAKETIIEVEKHIENKFWNTAINRMYYACFYAITALLIKEGVETFSHNGVRLKFGQLFVKNEVIDKDLAKHYTNLFDKRLKGDYSDFIDYTEEEVITLFPQTKLLVNTISELIKNTNPIS